MKNLALYINRCQRTNIENNLQHNGNRKIGVYAKINSRANDKRKKQCYHKKCKLNIRESF